MYDARRDSRFLPISTENAKKGHPTLDVKNTVKDRENRDS